MGDVAALTWPLTRLGGPLAMPRQSRARRCLFGPVDPLKTEKILKQQMQNIIEEEKAKWNFDFEEGKPLPGQYNWQEVGQSAGGQGRPEGDKEPSKEEQTLITDYMRKRKSSSSQKESASNPSKTTRRSST